MLLWTLTIYDVFYLVCWRLVEDVCQSKPVSRLDLEWLLVWLIKLWNLIYLLYDLTCRFIACCFLQRWLRCASLGLYGYYWLCSLASNFTHPRGYRGYHLCYPPLLESIDLAMTALSLLGLGFGIGPFPCFGPGWFRRIPESNYKTTGCV